jgi:hypothetical protein
MTKGAFTKFRTNQLTRLPIHSINFSDPNDKILHDQMVQLVDRMLLLNKQLPTAKTAHEKTILQRQIARLVYNLYGLTDKEIKIVERQTK